MESATRLLIDATHEITRLRQENALMSARLEMFDSLMAVLNTDLSRKGEGMSPDLVWEINKFIENQPK